MSNIQEAMGLVNELHKDHAIKQKGGKMYLQVVHRVEAFRRTVGADYGIDTRILVDDGHRVVVKAIVTNADGITLGSGMAEEIRGQGHVNTTSALENAETSAIGRALASLGLSGGEYASANEMEAVPRKQKNIDEAKEAGTTPVQAVAVEKKDPPSQASPAPSDRKPGKEVATYDEKDPNRKHDEGLYLELQSYLRNVKHVSGVHQKFMEVKPKLMEIKARMPHRAEMIFELFSEAEDRLS